MYKQAPGLSKHFLPTLRGLLNTGWTVYLYRKIDSNDSLDPVLSRAILCYKEVWVYFEVLIGQP